MKRLYLGQEEMKTKREKLGKPETLTPEMFFLLVRLFEEYYYLAKAFICRQKLAIS